MAEPQTSNLMTRSSILRHPLPRNTSDSHGSARHDRPITPFPCRPGEELTSRRRRRRGRAHGGRRRRRGDAAGRADRGAARRAQRARRVDDRRPRSTSPSSSRIGPEEFAEALRYRNAAFRTRMVQVMLLGEMLLVPIPPEVSARVEKYAAVARCRRRHDRRRPAHRQRLARARAHRLRAQRLLRADARASRRRTSTRRARCPTRGSSRAPTTRSTPSGRRSSTAPTDRSGQGVWRFYRARGLHVPGTAGERAADARAARLDPRARRLRLDRRVGDRGVRPHLARQRRSRGVLAARDGARPVRDRLPLRRGARASSSTTAVTSRATSTAWRCGSPTRCTAARCSPRHLNDTGRHDADRPPRHRLVRARRPSARRGARRLRAAAALGARRSPPARRPRGSRAASRRSSTRTGATSPRPRAATYESYGAEPA